MMAGIKNEIDKRNEVVLKISEYTEKKLKNSPKGKIYVRHNKSKVYYYFSEGACGSKERMLGKKDRELISELLQKNYLDKVYKAAKNELEALKRIKSLYPEIVAEEVYENLSEDKRMLVIPVVLTDEQLISKWEESEYTPHPISNEVPFYQTMKGERVRSKSEVIIADRLFANGIPYKYECPIRVGDKIIHPDFSILRISDRKIVYYEHCGKMDDPKYAEDIVNRVNDYSREGIILGDRLFMTFETSQTPLDVRVLDNMIKNNFM